MAAMPADSIGSGGLDPIVELRLPRPGRRTIDVALGVQLNGHHIAGAVVIAAYGEDHRLGRGHVVECSAEDLDQEIEALGYNPLGLHADSELSTRHGHRRHGVVLAVGRRPPVGALTGVSASR